MSGREKMAWVSLLSTVVIWLPYFSGASMTWMGGNPSPGRALLTFTTAVLLQMLLSIGGGLFVAATSRREPKDERDRAIESFAVRFAYYLAISLGFATFGFSSWLSLAGDARPVSQASALLTLGQLILLCFVLAEASRFAMQVIGYRRGV